VVNFNYTAVVKINYTLVVKIHYTTAWKHSVILQGRNRRYKLRIMEVKKEKQDAIIATAQRVMYYNELLIEQCNSWLSAEEGNRIMEARILENMRKEKAERKALGGKRWGRWRNG